MDPIEIRVARPDDAEAIERYHDECFRNTYAAQLLAGEFEAPDRDGTREQLRSWFTPGSEFVTLVADLDGVPIGHVTVFRHHLIHLFVEPNHHGTGLGRQLLARGEALLADGGYTDVELHTRVENHTAVAFYEAMGWTVTDRQVHTVEHGISYHEHVLVKAHRPTGASTDFVR